MDRNAQMGGVLVRWIWCVFVAVGLNSAALAVAQQRQGVATSGGIAPIANEVVSLGPGPEEQSEFLMGSTAVGLILVESRNGPLNWSAAEENQTVDGVSQALHWWEAQEPRANLRFQLEVHTRVPVSVEPILGPITEGPSWAGEALAELGYGAEPDPLLRVRSFNNDLRLRYGTDWAFSLFVADADDSRLLGLFSDIQYERTAFGGSWAFMSRYSSWAYNWQDYFRVVPAHVLGHIFYATDEYDDNPPEYAGYLAKPDANGETSIMNLNTLVVGPATRGQIGWVDSDGDGVFDILDTQPLLEVSNVTLAPDSRGTLVLGVATSTALPSNNPLRPWVAVTIARIHDVRAQVDGTSWVNTSPTDGAFDGYRESFQVVLGGLPPGEHRLNLRAWTSVGNFVTVNASFRTDTKPDASSPLWLWIAIPGSGTVLALVWFRFLRRRRRAP